MDITPADIRNMDLQKTWLRGYRRGFIDELLEEIADSYGAVVRERERLAARVEELEAEASQRASSRRSCVRHSCPPRVPRRR